MPIVKLTDRTLGALPAPTEREREYYWDQGGRGFGVAVSRNGTKAFIVRGRVPGQRALVKRTIGIAGKPDPDGQPWNVLRARIRADKIFGELRGGKVPVRRVESSGPTLREGLDEHVAEMRKKGCSERSIDTIESEVPRLLAGWLDRPIVDLKRSDMRELHSSLTAAGKPYLANRVKAQVSAIWNTLNENSDEGLPGVNPAKFRGNRYTPSRARVANEDLANWHATVNGLTNPVRRDLQVFCLFTGMRSEAARSVRWEHVDEKRGALTVPKPKGGERRAFTLPLPRTVLDMLKLRRAGNRDIFGPFGGDGGWVFASFARDGQTVQPVAEPKEYRTDADTGKKVALLPGLHTLRRTYLSVASDAGVSELDRHVLANHAYGRQSVNATYIEQAFDHLAACQAKIEAALWKQLGTSTTAKGRAKLPAV